MIGKAEVYCYPVEIISYAVWSYHRFNLSYQDIQEQLAFQGITVIHEAMRTWCMKFDQHYRDVIKKLEQKPTGK